jgi:hypothetical protein
MVTIPKCKGDVLMRNDHGRVYPALNVKYYGDVEYTAARIAKETGCTAETAARVAKWCYEAAIEDFWERALDSLNFAMLGDKRASEYKPCGLKDGPYKVYGAGRSGGTLIVEGLPPVEEWNGPTFMKWRKFARLIQEEMEHFTTWEYAKDMIDANDWCPKADTGEAIRADAKDSNQYGLAAAALAIHELMDGTEWSADTLEAIADELQSVGLKLRDFQGHDTAGVCDNFYEGSMGQCARCGCPKSAHNLQEE